MSKTVKVSNEGACIGCEMCVMECQRQLKKVGLEGAYVRILRNAEDGTRFEVSVDPKISSLNAKKIVDVCPQGVFEETEDNGA